MATKKSRPKIKAEKRKIVGRKVKQLRHEGLMPANIYGKKIKSQAVQLLLKEFLPIYQESGETRVVDLKVTGETKTRPVLIHNVQIDPVTDQPLHADFYQVSLKEKVTAEIPVELVGESPAVKEKLGILVHLIDEVEVEALPTELPDKFSLDISGLKAVDDMVRVSNLEVTKGVKILTGAKQVLAKIEPLTKKEEEAPPEKEEEEAAEEAVEVEEVEEGKKVAEEAGEKAQPEVAKPETGQPTSKEQPEKKPESSEKK